MVYPFQYIWAVSFCFACTTSLLTVLLCTELAEKCGAWAKALHYREVEFKTMEKEPGDVGKAEVMASVCEALISINQQLDLPEAAMGILLVAPPDMLLVNISFPISSSCSSLFCFYGIGIMA